MCCPALSFGMCVLGVKALLLEGTLACGQADAGQLPALMPLCWEVGCPAHVWHRSLCA